jgi:hypothetical protein
MAEFGGCLCGAVRYRVRGEPVWVAHCHCKSCQRASGSAVLPFAGFATEGFEIVQGTPVRFASSPGVARSFCPTCGTPLTYQAERFPGEVHITLGSLDAPAAFTPTAHVWTEDRVASIAYSDGLRHHPKGSAGPAEPVPQAAVEAPAGEHGGHCLCGSVRYAARGETVFAAHCHCGMCKRSSGAAFMTFAGFPTAAVEIIGELTAYRSSERAARSFCGRCGSPVRFDYGTEPDIVYLTLGTLDRPEAIRPLAHWHAAERVPWLQIDDDLPRYDTEPDT